MIALTSSTVVSRAAMNDRSTMDTLIVGTRIALAIELAVQLGQHQAHGSGRAVLVGIMLMVAERARRRSSWYTSVSTWSLVYAWTVVISP